MIEERFTALENDDARRVLIVDDEKDFAASLEDIFESRGYWVEKAHSSKEALEKIEKFDAQVLLLDIRLGRSSGIDLIRRLSAVRSGILTVMMTAYASTDTAIEALQRGAYDYLRKPLDANELLLTIDRCFEKLNLEKKKATAEALLRKKNKELEEINARLRKIVESTRDLAACSKIQDLAPLLLEEFAHNMAALGGSLYLREGDVLILKHSLDSQHMPPAIEFPLKKGSIFERVISSAEPILIQDIEKKKIIDPSGWKGYKNGSLLVFPLPDETGEIIGVISLQNKVEPPFTIQDKELGTILASYSCETLRAAKALEELRESERRYRLITENTIDCIWTTDLDTRFTYISPSAKPLFGYIPDELVGQHVSKLVAPESLAAALDILKEELAKEHSSEEQPLSRILDMKVISNDGSIVWTENQMNFLRDEAHNIVGFVGVTRSIDERRALEMQLRNAQKMEAIGTLAGGIAHDFNNILSPLIGYAELLKEDLPADHPLFANANVMLHAALRARDLVRQILTFSRKSEAKTKPIKLQPILKEALDLLRSSIPKTIDMQQRIDSECGIINADPTQIHQIIMNLATNAYHAMENTGGKLTVTLKKVLIEREYSEYPDLLPGNYARLIVSDTGIGIEKEMLEKVFDPYFTTKGEGKGTGLGLSVVHGIVKECGGDIRIYSEPGKGTEIHVYFPVIETVAENFIEQAEAIPGGTESILLGDDEEMIASMGQQLLERLGYKVTVRTGSIEALEAFKANTGRFDLIITDMTMPNMTGIQFAQEVKKIRATIPIIICTGFSTHLSDEKCRKLGIQGYVMKPIMIRELAAIIRKVLEPSLEV